MTAVSQSYPEYLGGLNEQPDERKKPGQLVEALNVIPDPTIGLSRRPGFKLIPYTNYATGDPEVPNLKPGGTWFEMQISNDINLDFIYFGHINNDGGLDIFNQDGELQLIKYTDIALPPHKKYEYNNGQLIIRDESNKKIIFNIDGNDLDYVPVDSVDDGTIIPYFEHKPEFPLKYCISKNHAIISNQDQLPSLGQIDPPTTEERGTYYSFINLKVIDTENYDYVFKRFFGDDDVEEYTYINQIALDTVYNLGDRYDEDLTLPLNGKSFQFSLDGPGITEAAIVEVTFTGRTESFDSNEGDGYRLEARYTWDPKLITTGKGYKKNQVYRETLSSSLVGPDLPDLTLTFKIKEVTNVLASKNVDITPGDVSNLGATEILNNLAKDFEANGIDKAVVVGNGIYLENLAPFSVSTDEIAVADVMNSQELEDDEVPIVRVNTVAELPVECYAGFIVEVINSFDNKNNYYLQYKSESQTEEVEFTKADGYWEEIEKPFEPFQPEPSTLPHMITVAKESDRDEFTFIVSPMDYIARSAGTVKDNPSMFLDGARISSINYYKNRLFFFTNIGTVISSKAGEINNLFIKTALTTSPVDPIDLIANSNQRVPIFSSAVVNNGLVLFGDSEQYSLTTANDVLSSETASLTKIANYTFNSMSDPIYLGTNLGFVSAGFSRFYEMTNVYDRGPVDINERSQQIQTRFGQGFNMPVSSREQSQVIVYHRYTTSGSKDMMMYRFRQENSQESTQTSWVRWDVDEPILYVSMPRDRVYVVLESGKFYEINSSVIQNTNNPTLELPIPKFTDGWTDTSDGVPYTTKITFPTIYPRGKESYDVTANTTIHRVKLSTALIGTYDLTIDREGYESYSILVEQTPSDNTFASSPPDVTTPIGDITISIPPLRGEHIETVPIYTRNKNLTLTMSTDYDAPLTLRSMTWEGDWNPPYYKRV